MKIVFTDHAQDRMKTRGFLQDEIVFGIVNADRITRSGSRYIYEKNSTRGSFEVVCEVDKMKKIIYVITVLVK